MYNKLSDMVKTQIQLPDELYKRLKRLAREREWSLAETLRRGAEYMTSVYPENADRRDAWELPKAGKLGRPQIPCENWREAANERDSL